MIDRFEVEFLPVGAGEKSGDCVLFHYFEDNEEKILVYDGGTKKSGAALVNHVRKYYGKERIDYLVNSHPDMDHVSGLIYIVENLEVGEIWMHKPWEHSQLIRDLFHDRRMTDTSLSNRLKDKLAMANQLACLAEEKNIPVYEPYAGSRIGPLVVLSPDKDWYLGTLLPDFTKSPEKSRVLVFDSIRESLESVYESVKNFVSETLGDENLPDNVITSAENNSSVILYGDFNSQGYLLTGDSGVEALKRACEYADRNGYRLQEYIKFTQVPHHGSRRNVSTEALDAMFGEPYIKDFDTQNFKRVAFISASESSTKHPRDRVVNAFIRRGFKVLATKGSTKRYKSKMPDRDGWSKSETLKFSDKVEGI